MNTDDTFSQEENLLQTWLPFQQKDTQIVIQILTKLKGEIQKLLVSFIENGDNFIQQLDDQIQQLKEKSNNIGKMISELTAQVFQDHNKLNNIISDQIFEGERIKELCKSQLRTLINSEILNDCYVQIQQINFNDTIERMNRILYPQELQQKDNWICEQHQKLIKFVQLNGEISNKLGCDNCKQNNKYGQYITLNDLKRRWNLHILETLKTFNSCQSQLISKSQQMIPLIQSLRQNFSRFIEQMIKQQNHQNNLESDQIYQQFHLMQKDWFQLSTIQLTDIAYICSQQNQNELIEFECRSKDILIQKILNEFKSFSDMLKIQYESFLNYWNRTPDNNIKNEEIDEKDNQAAPLKYQLIEQYNIKEEKCLSFAFNVDSSVLVVGYNRFIKVFQFQQGRLTETQIIDDHKDYVRCLYFMNRSNQFISGCNDCKIMIWSCNSKNIWYCQQVLEGHTDYVRAGVIMNNREDLIISGSDDRTIRFWSKKNNLWNCKQILNGHSKEVRSISLNTSSTQLISCSSGSEIFITEYDINARQWCIVQIIESNQCGYSIKFIKEDLFTFQPYDQGTLQVYKLDLLNRKSQIIQELRVQSSDNRLDFFPQQFIEDKSILLHKNGDTINIIKINKTNNKCTLVQSIHNSDVYLYGSMTRDGKYLITWDTDSRCIRVRKYEQ